MNEKEKIKWKIEASKKWKWRAFHWEDITDEIKRGAFCKLGNKWQIKAGRDWPSVTDEMKKEAFLKLNDKWICRIGE